MNLNLNKIIALGTILGMLAGIYTFVYERPTAVVAKLEDKVDRGFDKVYDTMETRRSERNAELSEMRKEFAAQVQQSTKELKTQLDRIEDRIYDMQKRQKEENVLRGGGVYSEDI